MRMWFVIGKCMMNFWFAVNKPVALTECKMWFSQTIGMVI